MFRELISLGYLISFHRAQSNYREQSIRSDSHGVVSLG
jgi:hypothetical protein